MNVKMTIKFRPKLLTVSIMAGLASQSAIAVDTTPTTTLQTITVTASDYSPRDAKGQEDSVYADETVPMQQASHFRDYLEEVPGVSVGGTSSVDQGIYIRGVNDKDLKITVDGVRQENYLFHHATNLALDSDLYKEAEVSVGNNSVTLGNNARSGGVAFTTVDASDLLKPNQTVGARLKAGYHSNDDQVLGVATVYGKPADNVEALVSYGMRDIGRGTDGDGNPLMTKESDIQNILAKVSVMPAYGHKVTANFSRYEDDGVFYGGGNKYDPTADYTDDDFADRENTNDQYSLKYEYTPSENFELDMTAYSTERAFNVRDSRGGVDGISVQAVNRLDRPVVSMPVSHTFVYGGEAYRKHSTNTVENEDGTTQDNKQEADSYGVYVEDQMDFGRFSLTPGVRFDHYKPASNVSKEDYNEVSGALAGSVDVTDNVNLFASYTQFFSGPPLPETIFNSDGSSIYVPDDLDPETGANTEFGVSMFFDDLLAGDDHLRFVAKTFQTDFDNAVSYARRGSFNCALGEQEGGQCTRYVNSGETTIDGYEISANYLLDEASVTASYSHSENDQDEAYELRNPGDTLNLTFGYDLGGMPSLGYGSRIGLGVKHVDDVTKGDIKYDGYQTVDVYGSYVPATMPDLKFDLGVYNLTDEHYASTSDYAYGGENTNYAMGRNVKVSASYRF